MLASITAPKWQVSGKLLAPGEHKTLPGGRAGQGVDGRPHRMLNTWRLYRLRQGKEWSEQSERGRETAGN